MVKAFLIAENSGKKSPLPKWKGWGGGGGGGAGSMDSVVGILGLHFANQNHYPMPPVLQKKMCFSPN